MTEEVPNKSGDQGLSRASSSEQVEGTTAGDKEEEVAAETGRQRTGSKYQSLCLGTSRTSQIS